MYRIDLHGMRHREALLEVEDRILAASQLGPFVMEIITGNSSSMQDKVISLLEKYNFSFYIPSYNLGMIIVNYNLL